MANFLTAAAAATKTGSAQTVLALNQSPSMIKLGQTAAFSAVVTSKVGGTISGTVQFYADGSALGAPVVVDASGMAATPAVPFPAAGTYFISAVYSGDGTYAAADRAGIFADGYRIVVFITTVGVSSTAISVGSSQTLKITVAPGSGTGTPTGVVRVVVSSASTGTALTVPLSNGTATTPPIPFPAAGSYSVTASHHGDSVFSPSTGAGPSITVQRVPSVLQLSSLSSTIGVGGAVSYSVQVQGTAQGQGIVVISIPTGTVQLHRMEWSWALRLVLASFLFPLRHTMCFRPRGVTRSLRRTLGMPTGLPRLRDSRRR